MAKLLYQGHGSYRITGLDGTVLYIDPSEGDGYDAPADIVLISHQHEDHNKIERVTQKPGCCVISNVEALEGGQHNSFSIGDITIETVAASNQNHNSTECVGFIISLDGVTVYAAGDTSRTDEMESFASRKLDYALLPCDGVYNMSLEEAAECAKLIGAKHTIPIHMKPGALFDQAMADAFDAPNKCIMTPGQEMEL